MNPAISEMTVTYLVDAATSAVPQGYKQTDVGIIPDDWLCKDIGALNPFVTSGSRGWAEFYSEYGQPFVRITNTKRHSIYLDLSDLKFVKLPETSSEGKRTSLLNGDVLISITADIGISSYVDDSLVKPAYINQHIALVRFDLDEINSKFVTYFLSSENVQKLFRSTSDQGAKAGLNLDSVRKIKIALPSQSEQTAISNALSDVDALIQALEKLIAKKQAIKTATMQQLLTGRTRLPKFAYHPDGRKKGYKPSELGEIPEDWDITSLGFVFEFKNGLNKEKHYFGYGTPIVNYMDVYKSGGIEACTVEGKVCVNQIEIKNYSAKIGDVFFTRTSETVNEIGLSSVLLDHLKDAVFSGFVLRARQKVDVFIPLFVKYHFRSELPRKQIQSTASYTTRALTNGSLLSNVCVQVPNKDEQEAIAAILSDMDKEIRALDQRLNKTRQIKQGMVQELLTGKTRLVKPAGAA